MTWLLVVLGWARDALAVFGALCLAGLIALGWCIWSSLKRLADSLDLKIDV